MLKKLISLILVLFLLAGTLSVFATDSAVDWKTLYKAKIEEINNGYKNGTKGTGGIRDYGHNTSYFSVQDINFDGVPELYHAICSLYELNPSVLGNEEIYYIKNGSVIQGRITPGADFSLLPMGDLRKASPGDTAASRWQFVMRNQNSGEVCFVTKDTSGGYSDFHSITYSKLTFDSTTGTLNSQVLMNRDVDIYSKPVYLQGYDYIGADCYTSLTESKGWGIYDWKPAYSTPQPTVKVGDVIGEAYHTDIVAYINHYAISSYAVNGTSCIVAEDLRNFCFDVTWNGNARALTITRNSEITPKGMTFEKTGKPSTKFTDLLKTDIAVYAGGKRLTSYAINGYTMIPIEELTMFGECYWLSNERVVKLWIDGVSFLKERQPVKAYDAHSTKNQMDESTVQALLSSKISFTDFETKQKATVKTLPKVNEMYGGVASRYTVFDLDKNGTDELIVEYNRSGDTAIITLKNGDFVAYYVSFRGFMNLKTDGTMDWSNSAYESGTYKMVSFSDDGIVTVNTIVYNTGDVFSSPEYKVNGVNVSENEVINAMRAQHKKESVVWFDIN